MFDAVCGTSTGAIVATALSRRHFSPADIIKEFLEISPNIFPKRHYIIKKLKNIGAYVTGSARHDGTWFKEYLKNLNLSWSGEIGDPHLGIVALKRDKIQKSGFKIHLFTSYKGHDVLNIEVKDTEVVAIYDAQRIVAHITLDTAIRASCAAPTYLDPVTIDDFEFIDGGLESNCPVLEGIQLLRKDTNVKNPSCLISIGCGSKGREQGGLNGLIPIAKLAAQKMTDAEKKWNEFIAANFTPENESRYIRLNPDASPNLGQYQLDSAHKVKEILDTYVNWLSDKHLNTETSERKRTSEYRRKIIYASKVLFAKSFSILSVTVNGKLFSKSKTLVVTSREIGSVVVKVKFSANRSCSVESTESGITLVSHDAEQGGKKIKLKTLFSGNFDADHSLLLGKQGIINVKYDDVDIDGSPIKIRFSET